MILKLKPTVRRKTHEAVVWTGFAVSIIVSFWLIMREDVPFGVPWLAGIGAFEVILIVGGWLGLMTGKRTWKG